MSTILNKEEQTPFLDLRKIRDDFPILSRSVNKKPLVYADNAATTQKPKVSTVSQNIILMKTQMSQRNTYPKRMCNRSF